MLFVRRPATAPFNKIGSAQRLNVDFFLAEKRKHTFSLSFSSQPFSLLELASFVCRRWRQGILKKTQSCHADVFIQLKCYDKCRSDSYSIFGTIKAEKQGRDASAELLRGGTLWQTYSVKSPLNMLESTVRTLQWLEIECLFDLLICHIVMTSASKKAIKRRLWSLNNRHTLTDQLISVGIFSQCAYRRPHDITVNQPRWKKRRQAIDMWDV